MKETIMKEKNTIDYAETHPIQKILDNPWLLLGLGLAVPILSYTAWGLIEILSLTPATLP